jgi:hypothetical protein
MADGISNLEDLVRDMGLNIVDQPGEDFQDNQSVNPQIVDSPDAIQDSDATTANDSESSLADDTAQVTEPTGEAPNEPASDDNSTEGSDDNRYVYRQQDTDDSQSSTDEPTEAEVQSFVNDYLQEQLGLGLEDILSRINTPASIDERLEPILKFVQETGRDPQDWFLYQSLNPSEMDDLSVIKLQMQNDYPDLSNDEVDMLVSAKYKTDSEFMDEKEQKMASLQLKIDAGNARKQIDSLRGSYLNPVERTAQEDNQVESFVDEQWLSEMEQEVDALDGIDFELPGEKLFTFGINDKYRETIKSKNANLESYFDQYVDRSGKWNHELFSMHRTVVDNIDEIVKAVYQQGMSDGQRRVVETAANVKVNTPNVGNVQPGNNVEEQLRQIIGESDSMMRFRF